MIDDCLYLEVCKVPYLVYFFSCAKSILRNLVSRHFLFFISITISSDWNLKDDPAQVLRSQNLTSCKYAELEDSQKYVLEGHDKFDRIAGQKMLHAYFNE